MEHKPALDGVRAIAVLAVLAFHCKVPALLGGFVGVDIFFVLSGYLITTILRAEVVRSGSIEIGRFYWRRARRLTPALLLMLAAYLLAAPLLFGSDGVVRDTLLAGTYLSDYSKALFGFPDQLSHTWSLAVEAHFYLLWPFVILATRNISSGRLAGLLLVVFVLASGWRVADLALFGDWNWTYYRSDTRVSGLILGGVVAVVNWRATATARNWLGAASLAGLGASIFLWRWNSPSALTTGGILVDLSSGALIIALIAGGSVVARLLSWAPLVYIGAISYSIYLWHYPIARALRDQVDDPTTTFLAVSAVSVLIAAISFELIEKPLRSRPNPHDLLPTGRSVRRPKVAPP